MGPCLRRGDGVWLEKSSGPTHLGHREGRRPVAIQRVRTSAGLLRSARNDDQWAACAETRPLRSSLPQPTNQPATAEAMARITTQYMIWR